jgi:cysteine desulfurase
MIYLDYAATTPVMYEVLESLNKVTREFMANPNSPHAYGLKSRNLLDNATKQICELLNINESELTYTSGATESNNTAIKGIAHKYKHQGKHILVSRLEHPSIYVILKYLEKEGFQIEFLKHETNGLVSFDDLKKKIRKDTILVIINAVNSELGIRQPLKTIRQIIKKENPETLLHVDMTQAIGKVSVNLHDADSAAISSHKFYGPKGIGILYLSDKIKIEPLIHGSSKSSDLRGGTPPLPLIVGMSKALRIALTDLNHKEEHIKKLANKVISELLKLDGIVLNNTDYSIPHILNFSLQHIKPEVLINALSDKEIYISTKTACAKEDVSESIMALYNDAKRASSSIRISISHITTADEIERFINYFKLVYEELQSVGEK